MDIVLLAASGGLGSFLPIQDSVQASKSVRLALGLSFTLFSLSIIEVAPSKWLVFLDREKNADGLLSSSTTTVGNHHLTVTGAYAIVLWIFVIGILFVLPASVGGQVFQMAAAPSRNNKETDADDKYAKRWKLSPWWIRYSWQFTLLILSICYRIVLAPLVRLGLRQAQRFSPAMMEPILMMTNNNSHTNSHNNNDGSSSSSSSSRHGGPKSPTSNNNNHPEITLSSKSVILGGVCGIVSALIILKTLGSLVINLPRQRQQEMIPILSTLVSWLCAVGLMISSSLNGFGSVSLPYTCLAGLFLEPIRPEVLAKAEMELHSTTKSMELNITELHSDSFNNSSSSSSSSSGLLGDSSAARRRTTVATTTGKSGACFADFNSDESSKRKQVLKGEIDFLETLIGELKEDIVEMRHAQEQAASARTMSGKIRSYVGVLFSIILLVRLYMASISIICQQQSNNNNNNIIIGPQPERGDPITTALLWLSGHHLLVSNEDYNTLSQGISLLLTAFLSASQIRTFLRTVSAVNRRVVLIYRKCYCTQRHRRRHQTEADESSYHQTTEAAAFSSSHESSPYHQIHTRILAALTGCYFLSCVVLTKMNLPMQYRSSFAAALGGMEYSIRTPVVNLVFCCSAGISAMVLSLLFGIQRQNTKRHADEENVVFGTAAAAAMMMDVC